MQSSHLAVNDSKSTKMGGSRRRYKKGGNPDWSWPCSSGGKKRRTNRRNSRKNKKRTRRYN